MAAADNKHLVYFEQNKLLDGETVTGSVSAYRKDTTFEGMLILTSKRLSFYRKGMMSEKFEAYPLAKISSVEFKSGFIRSSLTIHVSHDDIQLEIWHESKTATKNFINQLQESINRTDSTGTAPSEVTLPNSSASSSSVDNPMEQLKKLGELKDAGVLTEEEFSIKKVEILTRI